MLLMIVMFRPIPSITGPSGNIPSIRLPPR